MVIGTGLMGHGNHFFRVYFFDDNGVFYDTFFKEHFVLLLLHFDCNLRSACLTPTVRGGKGTYSWGVSLHTKVSVSICDI